ncbi:MAG: ABC transporter ATP-binding protein [Acidobacteria bacterium]|nr:ABC transporter ATP-binding protein [Acidobacteriota bacterium]
MLIEVTSLTKRYGDITAVDDVSFQVDRGEILGYLGPNGAGKSTTVKMLTGIISPTGGRIVIDGVELSPTTLEVKQRIGYVPETGGVYESLTGFEFLQLIGRLYHMPEELIERKIREFFRLFNLEQFAHERLSSYSKGMRQKVLISSALIHNPEIIFFDEPLSGLDANSMLIFKELIRNLAEQGRTIFYSSHVLDVVERVCRRVIILDHGRIIADAPVEQLKEMTSEVSLEGVFRQLTDTSDIGEIARLFSEAVSAR